MITVKPLILIATLLISACATTDTEGTAFKNIDVVTTQSTLNNEKVVLLDVRTPEEYAQGHIPGSQLMDFHGEHFTEDLKKLDPNATYVVYCASGNRSEKASRMMQAQDFKQVSNVLGGFQAWQSQQLPVETLKAVN